MLMLFWKPILRLRAKKVNFDDSGYELSDSIATSYNTIKLLYKNLIKDMVNGDSDRAHLVLKDFLSFYLQSESLLLNLINEMFKKSFNETIEKRKPVFDILNKTLKLMMHIDGIRVNNPEIFCNYTSFKIDNPEEVEKVFTEIEDQRLAILGMIALPMGRLMISLFTSDKFELFYPTLLSKRARVYLDNERKKMLYTHCRIAEKYRYKYILTYFASIYKKFYGKNSYTFDYELPEMYREYIDMLYCHE